MFQCSRRPPILQSHLGMHSDINRKDKCLKQSLPLNTRSMSNRNIHASFARYCFLLLMYTSLLQPIPRLGRLMFILRLAWFVWLAISFTAVVYELLTNPYDSVGSIVGSALFIFNLLTNVVTFIESICKCEHYQELLRLEREVDTLLVNKIDVQTIIEVRVWHMAFYVVLIQIIYDVVQLVIAFTGYKSPVFYYVVVILFIQRARYAQITCAIARLNARSLCLITLLRVLVKANRPRHKYSSEVWQPYAVWEFEYLNLLRLIHGRLCELHRCVSNCFSWSIVILLFSTFFTTVSNLFWCIEIIRTNFQFGQFAYDALTILRLDTLAAVLLFTAEQAKKHNMLLGGLFLNLAKPLGNKTYNDLVSKFSLQCLQQGFMINVKGFFSLNLSLLGDLIVLSSTYLVILMQFDLYQGSNTKVNVIYNSMANEESMKTEKFPTIN
ncbi:putative gustatory receptor 39b [Ceratitis capitata]|uniref:putative gustatory receptor 39b n=1 Tax=Ceratitis capitata TaxID=7213 RepID=UPI0003297693|nr:putative gustatory receptor 39b [Ceratitis capitata]